MKGMPADWNANEHTGVSILAFGMPRANSFNFSDMFGDNMQNLC